MSASTLSSSSIPILDLSQAASPEGRKALLVQLRASLFDVGFLYVVRHGVPQEVIDKLVDYLPRLFELPREVRAQMSKLNSPHFLGHSDEETTLGKIDLREQFDMATELPVVYRPPVKDEDPHRSAGSQLGGECKRESSQGRRDFTQLYWRLRGPNQWPPDALIPGFREAFISYHDAVADLSYRFVHLVEEAFGIPIGTFDSFFRTDSKSSTAKPKYLSPQHRLKLLKYPPRPDGSPPEAQGVGAHKDSSGWLTFLYQVGSENALEVLSSNNEFIAAPPIPGTFVVNFGNAFEAATSGAVRATVHRVRATTPSSPTRYSIPFFQGLPLDLTVSEIREFIPQSVHEMRKAGDGTDRGALKDGVESFLDTRWDSLGESQLRKWIRSHRDVGEKWYGNATVQYYLH